MSLKCPRCGFHRFPNSLERHECSAILAARIVLIAESAGINTDGVHTDEVVNRLETFVMHAKRVMDLES